MKILMRNIVLEFGCSNQCLRITHISRYFIYGMNSRYPEFDGTREPATGGGAVRHVQLYVDKTSDISMRQSRPSNI